MGKYYENEMSFIIGTDKGSEFFIDCIADDGAQFRLDKISPSLQKIFIDINSLNPNIPLFNEFIKIKQRDSYEHI